MAEFRLCRQQSTERRATLVSTGAQIGHGAAGLSVARRQSSVGRSVARKASAGPARINAETMRAALKKVSEQDGPGAAEAPTGAAAAAPAAAAAAPAAVKPPAPLALDATPKTPANAPPPAPAAPAPSADDAPDGPPEPTEPTEPTEEELKEQMFLRMFKETVSTTGFPMMKMTSKGKVSEHSLLFCSLALNVILLYFYKVYDLMRKVTPTPSDPPLDLTANHSPPLPAHLPTHQPLITTNHLHATGQLVPRVIKVSADMRKITWSSKKAFGKKEECMFDTHKVRRVQARNWSHARYGLGGVV